MTQGKKDVEQITGRDIDFAKWYTDVVTKAELIDYSQIKGCVVLRPYAYALWENIQKILDDMFKKTGHENVYMPMFIPESLLQKEKDHVEGFAPEVAWVTLGGSEELTERICVRPTSETLFCDHYKNIIKSWRDLPKKYNQWCSVVRWEKTTRPFLRHREFLWQEGHTIHATVDEAREETHRMLDIYADFCENYLAMPVVKGQKTEKEKFAGAEETYTIECMMHDRKALQSATSHYFGDGFAKAFDIRFTDKDNTLKNPFQTSWGMSTRIIGGIIMTHGDDSGLKLPPKVAPVQVMVIPIAQHKEGVSEAADALLEKLKLSGLRAKTDVSDQSPGWKFAEYEMKGVPLRLEIGPKDIQNNQCIAVRRDTKEKIALSLTDIDKSVKELLDKIQKNMFEEAKANLDNNTFVAYSVEEMRDIIQTKGGFVKAMWCKDLSCELELKEKALVSSRCIPFVQEKLSDCCVCCGKPAKHMVVWAVAY
ncbi:MAG TPA: proline--tRNA ligase [Clostridia bacterium]|jgi:prolyl-tRNA synthetase|nr:proline--tRNA ligase [Clostridiaceae bacterium]HOF27009.1 proline--tRNA ligase [Clostridia bacterium]HOM34996.1 proline--tRNA ligase [Clostridia bacterium]HOR90275.1 proline--tRNA ligase [Clostridia bacterium]HOT70744.1 proline--tRNA ligase [Clostridia bacterium]